MRNVKPLIEAFENRRLQVILDIKRKSKDKKFSDELIDELLCVFDAVYLYLDENHFFTSEVSENIEKFYLEPIFNFDELSDYFDLCNSIFINSIYKDLYDGSSRYAALIHKKFLSVKYVYFLDVISNLIACCFRGIIENNIKIATVREAYASLNIAKSLRVYETLRVSFEEVYAKHNAEQIRRYEELRIYLEGFDLNGAIKSIVLSNTSNEYHEVVGSILFNIEKEVFRPIAKSGKDGQDIFEKWSKYGGSMINYYYSEKINDYLRLHGNDA